MTCYTATLKRIDRLHKLSLRARRMRDALERRIAHEDNPRLRPPLVRNWAILVVRANHLKWSHIKARQAFWDATKIPGISA